MAPCSFHCSKRARIVIRSSFCRQGRCLAELSAGTTSWVCKTTHPTFRLARRLHKYAVKPSRYNRQKNLLASRLLALPWPTDCEYDNSTYRPLFPDNPLLWNPQMIYAFVNVRWRMN